MVAAGSHHHIELADLKEVWVELWIFVQKELDDQTLRKRKYSADVSDREVVERAALGNECQSVLFGFRITIGVNILKVALGGLLLHAVLCQIVGYNLARQVVDLSKIALDFFGKRHLAYVLIVILALINNHF